MNLPLLVILPFLLDPGVAPIEADRTDRIWRAADARMRAQTEVWFKEGDYPRVVQILRLRAESASADYETWTDLGWMLENIERDDEALAIYRRYRQANPKDPDAPFPEANFYFRARQYDRVPPLIEPSLALKPHGNSFRILAHSYERLGKLEDAKRVWIRHLELSPDDGAARANLARVEGKLAEKG